MRVLITRPAQDAERTAEILKARGHEAVLAPLFSVKLLPHNLASEPDAFLATSANTLRHLSLSGVDCTTPIFTVGNATAVAAKLQGFTDVYSAGGDGDDLARLVRSQLRPGANLVYLTGKPRNDKAVNALADIYTIETVETYETIAANNLPDAASDGLKAGTLDAVLHFSPRAAQIFAELVDIAGVFPQANRLLHVFISLAAEMPRYRRRAIAGQPTLESMLESLEKT